MAGSPGDDIYGPQQHGGRGASARARIMRNICQNVTLVAGLQGDDGGGPQQRGGRRASTGVHREGVHPAAAVAQHPGRPA